MPALTFGRVASPSLHCFWQLPNMSAALERLKARRAAGGWEANEALCP